MTVRAKRGWWLAVERTERTFYIGRPTEERTRVDLFEVTSCTRDGLVKDCRDAKGYAVGASWSTGRALTISSEMVASDDVRRAALAHHWPNHPDQPMPFESLIELRDALRPYRIQVSA